ncbi:MAG TPA: hypothetical protein VGB46_00195 [Flavisolibacter sp.]|jgi:hypothetical protein
MKKIVLYTILLFAIIAGCSKFRDMKGTDDFKDGAYIRGRLFLVDSLTQNGIASPLGNKKLTISYADSQDTLNYLYEVSTSADGYFTFPNLRTDKTYRIRYKETLNGILFSADQNATTADTVRLFARVALTGQTGIHLVLSDSTGPVRGDTICVFTSSFQFNSNNCAQATYSLITDTFGRASRFNVPPGKYYFYSTLTVNNHAYEVKDSMVVTNKVEFDTLRLRSRGERNGFFITVMDDAGMRVPNVQLCFFTSRQLFLRDTCQGQNFSVNADTNGDAIKYDLMPGKYYIFSELNYPNFSLVARDSIIIADRVKYDTVYLK